MSTAAAMTSRLLAVKGFTNADLTALHAILTLSEEGLDEPWEITDCEEVADAVAVSLGTEVGKQWWTEHSHSGSQLPVVGCGLQVPEQWRWNVLMGPKRPPSLSALTSLLNQLSRQLSLAATEAGQCVETIHESDPPPAVLDRLLDISDIPDVEPISFDDVFYPHRYLAGLINTAMALNENRGYAYNGNFVLISPETGEYFATKGLENLIALCQVAVERVFEWHLTNEALLREIQRKELISHPLDDLRWFCTLVASNGRLWHGFQITDRVRLNRWPPLGGLPYFNKYQPLADYMTAKTDTLANIADKTNFEMADVIDFHNACHALGLVERQAVMLATEKPLRLSLRTIYQMITKKLSI
jgi:hypothetical protein